MYKKGNEAAMDSVICMFGIVVDSKLRIYCEIMFDKHLSDDCYFIECLFGMAYLKAISAYLIV